MSTGSWYFRTGSSAEMGVFRWIFEKWFVDVICGLFSHCMKLRYTGSVEKAPEAVENRLIFLLVLFIQFGKVDAQCYSFIFVFHQSDHIKDFIINWTEDLLVACNEIESSYYYYYSFFFSPFFVSQISQRCFDGFSWNFQRWWKLKIPPDVFFIFSKFTSGRQIWPIYVF